MESKQTYYLIYGFTFRIQKHTRMYESLQLSLYHLSPRVAQWLDRFSEVQTIFFLKL